MVGLGQGQRWIRVCHLFAAGADLFVQTHQAVAVYEEEDKQLYSQDAFRHAVVLQLRTKKWADAVATLLRFAVACDANGAEQSQRRAYLGAVVVGGTTAYTTLEGR